MRKVLPAFALVAALLLPSAALAWNGTGHMAVARIAYANLNDNTRTRVDRLLLHHPDFDKLSAGLRRRDRDFGLIVFMRASVWPDDIKSDRRFFEDGGTPTRLLPGFPSMERHRPWHFIDVPFSTDGTQTAEPPSPNALEQLPRLIGEIGSDAPRNIQAYDLAWLLHLAGDVHQPLHATARFTTRHGPPEGDRGGNLFQIKNGQSNTNLHSFWDGLLGTSTNTTFIKGLGTTLMNETPAENPANTNVQAWIDDSFNVAKTVTYTIGPDGANDPRPSVTQAYRTEARQAARQRAALAGYRIAAILNERLP